MEESKRKEILEKIRQIDDPNSPVAPQNAERLLAEVLSPLLEQDGYQVNYTGNTGRDHGVDFVANKLAVGDFPADTIGIEYKHSYAKAVGAETVHRILGASISAGFSRGMIVTNSRFTFAAREAIRRQAHMQIELLDIDALRAWVSRIEEIEKVDVKTVEIIRSQLNKQFIQLIAQNPRYLDEVEWRELERILTEIFEGIGFGVELTPGSKDGGKDIILKCKVNGRDHTYYVEIKHWRSGQGVGGGIISDFLNIIINEEADGGLFLSTYGYCSNAIESLTEIQRQRLRFGQEQKVAALCKTYIKAQSGIWSPPTSLVELLYDGTN
jgi:restriction endonuclease Mrr